MKNNIKFIGLSKDTYKPFLLILSILTLVIYPYLTAKRANATYIPTWTGVYTNRMSLNTATGGTVCMKPSQTHTGSITNVKVTFPGNGTQGAASYGVNSTAGNWTVTTTNLPLSATAWPNIATATNVTGSTVTFNESSAATLNAGTLYCFNFNSESTLTTPSSANSNLVGAIYATDSTPANSETNSIAMADITSGTDQIVVTASVAATFSFSLTPNTFALGIVPTTANGVSAGPNTMTITTNAPSGWTAWVADANNGTLTSVSSGGSIGTAGSYVNSDSNIVDLATGTGFYFDAVTGTNSPTIDPAYSGYGKNANYTSGGYLSNSFQRFAYQATSANASTVSLYGRARITGTQIAASDYTDTITITAAGQF